MGSYWAQWQVGVCAVIIALPAAAAVTALIRAKPFSGDLRRGSLWSPCWLRLHPLWLLGFRAAAFLSMSFILIRFVLIGSATSEFFFYTQWTFTLVTIYFAVATLVSARGCCTYSKEHAHEIDVANGLIGRKNAENITVTVDPMANHCADESKPLSNFVRIGDARKPGCLGYTMQILYQTSAGASLLTDVVFWGLLVPFLSPKDFSVNLVMGCMHSLNVIFLLIDTLLNRMPFSRLGFMYFVLWSSIYVIFQWILHAFGVPRWPYPFLELSTPWAPLWYLALVSVHVPCYAFYYLIVKGKNTLLPRFFPHAFVKDNLASK